MTQVVEYLPSKCGALLSTTDIVKKKKSNNNFPREAIKPNGILPFQE
jgi:hypothetical protein